MLAKDPSKRTQMDNLKLNAWLNDGYKTNLSTIDPNLIEDITEIDVTTAIIPLHVAAKIIT